MVSVNKGIVKIEITNNTNVLKVELCGDLFTWSHISCMMGVLCADLANKQLF